MNTSRIKELAGCLETLNSVRFSKNNRNEISFETNYRDINGDHAIKNSLRIIPTDTICTELNFAIKPFIDKYIQICEEELKACLNE